jgi:hypothetical protein
MAAYCRKENVKLSSLSDWQRKIRERDQASESRTSRQTKPSSRYRRTGRASSQPRAKASTGGAPDFAPVHIIDESPSVEHAQESGLDIVLPGGIVLRLRDNCSMSLLVKVISSLEGRNV